MIITVDGPAASGKSTVAKGIAKVLGFTYLDTGAMYRALTWETIQRGISIEDPDALFKLAKNTQITFAQRAGSDRVFISTTDVTEQIRSPEVTKLVSVVSKIAKVRQALVDKQRQFTERGENLVVEGRDIGTVVFPKAEVKIFLNASLQERARRRQSEWETKGHQFTVSELESGIKRRDDIDSSRADSPLAKANDAIEIDTTNKGIDLVIEEVVALVRRKAAL